MEREIQEKYVSLKRILTSMKSALLSLSGGVDSTLLLAAGKEALGENLIAVTIDSPLQPEAAEAAASVARKFGVEHILFQVNELELPAFLENPPDRCYLCKRERLRHLLKIAQARGLAAVIDGTNKDDAGDYRPGIRAATEMGVRSPLLEGNLSKNDIRNITKALGQSQQEKDPSTCYATRIPYGMAITSERLDAIRAGEKILEEMGFNLVRVRLVNEKTVRIEVEPGLIPKLVAEDTRLRVLEEMRSLGFLYITLDIAGYRQGSLNEFL